MEYRRNNNTSIDYFAFVIDSESFGKTVENILHVSFLIRDGKCKKFKGI